MTSIGPGDAAKKLSALLYSCSGHLQTTRQYIADIAFSKASAVLLPPWLAYTSIDRAATTPPTTRTILSITTEPSDHCVSHANHSQQQIATTQNVRQQGSTAHFSFCKSHMWPITNHTSPTMSSELRMLLDSWSTA